MGSGWCGPADLLASERDADVVALTVSEAQSFYCRSRGHRTVHANAETLNLADTFGYDSFDVSFLLESLEHISNKRDLLSRLRDVSSKLLIRTCGVLSARIRIQTHNERVFTVSLTHIATHPRITFVINTLEHYSNTGTSCLKQSFASAKLEFDDSMYVESCDDVLNHVREAGWVLEDVRSCLSFENFVHYHSYSLHNKHTNNSHQHFTLSLEPHQLTL